MWVALLIFSKILWHVVPNVMFSKSCGLKVEEVLRCLFHGLPWWAHPLSKQLASGTERLWQRPPDPHTRALPRARWEQEKEAKMHKKLQGQESVNLQTNRSYRGLGQTTRPHTWVALPFSFVFFFFKFLFCNLHRVEYTTLKGRAE